MKNKIELISSEEIRIDKFLASRTEFAISRTKLKELINLGYVTVNNLNIAKSNHRLKINDVIRVDLTAIEKIDFLNTKKIEPEKIDLDVIYEDDDLLVINKQHNLTIHGNATLKTGTLVNGLMYHFGNNLSNINSDEKIYRPGIVHRIDKNTTGLIIIAKNNFTHIKLSEQFQNRTVLKKYYVVVSGKLKSINGTINMKIGKCPNDFIKQCVNGINSKEAITHFEALSHLREYKENFFLLSVKIDTGRTHQIRCHLKHIKLFVVNDNIYGESKYEVNDTGQLLHCYHLRFFHPTKKIDIDLTAPIPKKFIETLEQIKHEKH